MATPFYKAYNDFSGGLQEYTAPTWLQANESPFLTNVDVSIPGVLKKALGYSELGSHSGGSGVKGLGIFEKEDGTYTPIKWDTSSLYKFSSGTWSSFIGSLSSSVANVEMVNAFLDNTDRIYFCFDPLGTEEVSFYDGTTFTQIANTYAKHMELFENRLYLANIRLTSTDYPIRVMFSGVGVDTFNTSDDYFEDVGEPITGLKAYNSRLHIWSENKLFAFDGGPEGTLVEIPGDYGTTSAKSIQIVQGNLTWYNRGGVYMYAGAGKPTLISTKIQGWIDAITAPTSVAGGIDSKGRYLLYIGTVTYKGTEYANVCLRYDALTNVWDRVPARPFGVFALQKSGGNHIALAGDLTSRKVWTVDGSQGLDSTTTLPSEYQTAKFDAGEPQYIKNFYSLWLTYKPSNVSEYLTVKYRMDGDTSWTQIEGTNNNVDLSGTLDIKTVRLDLKQAEGRFIQFQFTHSSNTGSFEIYELKLEGDIHENR